MTATETLTLIVEDDRSTRELIAQALAKHGIYSLEAGTVGEGLMRLERGPLPSTVVLDLRLPDASGVILLRRIRREQLPIRVAVVTGMADPERLFESLNFAPDRIFKKPLELAKLIAWLREE